LRPTRRRALCSIPPSHQEGSSVSQPRDKPHSQTVTSCLFERQSSTKCCILQTKKCCILQTAKCCILLVHDKSDTSSPQFYVIIRAPYECHVSFRGTYCRPPSECHIISLYTKPHPKVPLPFLRCFCMYSLISTVVRSPVSASIIGTRLFLFYFELGIHHRLVLPGT